MDKNSNDTKSPIFRDAEESVHAIVHRHPRAAVGGGIGAALGAAVAGPLGAALGGAVGGGLGSMFDSDDGEGEDK